nr:hypothetical protein [uncultured Allomuricauda sp.]
MCLYYNEEKENQKLAAHPGIARRSANIELDKAKKALADFHEIDINDIYCREVMANKPYGDKQGAYEKYHVVKNETLVEILDFFYTYDGTYISVFSHHPNPWKSKTK